MNRAEQLADIKLYISSGWELKEETPEHFLLVKRASFLSHLIVFLFTCYSLGVGNVLWYFICRKNKKIVK